MIQGHPCGAAGRPVPVYTIDEVFSAVLSSRLSVDCFIWLPGGLRS